jgi:hypothetical protein
MALAEKVLFTEENYGVIRFAPGPMIRHNYTWHNGPSESTVKDDYFFSLAFFINYLW